MVDPELISSINYRLKTKFEKDLFQASFRMLDYLDNPIRCNCFAFSLRELTRVVLSRLAPDEKVLNCQWYRNETANENGITRKQRMLYAIRGGLSDDFVENELDFRLDDVTKQLKDVIDVLSKYTHVSEKTFSVSVQQAENMIFGAIKALNDFFDSIDKFRHEISSAYESRLFDLVTKAMISDTIQEIDILATHYWIEYCSIEDIKVHSIDDAEISIMITGIVDVVHQYGSDRDYRRGDGFRMDGSYPYQIPLTIDATTPLEMHIDVEKIEIDNSSFYY